jgi:hypothetical protein
VATPLDSAASDGGSYNRMTATATTRIDCHGQSSRRDDLRAAAVI